MCDWKVFELLVARAYTNKARSKSRWELSIPLQPYLLLASHIKPPSVHRNLHHPSHHCQLSFYPYYQRSEIGIIDHIPRAKMSSPNPPYVNTKADHQAEILVKKTNPCTGQRIDIDPAIIAGMLPTHTNSSTSNPSLGLLTNYSPQPSYQDTPSSKLPPLVVPSGVKPPRSRPHFLLRIPPMRPVTVMTPSRSQPTSSSKPLAAPSPRRCSPANSPA